MRPGRTTRRTAPRTAALLAAAFTAVIATATSAFAGTVSPGGPFTATKSPWTITDATTGVTLGCRSLTLGGTLAGSAGTLIGSVTATTATACAGPAGIAFTLTFQGLPWRIDELAYDAATGVSTGTVTGVRVLVSSSVMCSAAISGAGGPTSPGTLDWSHGNAVPQNLTITGNGPLRVSNATGCLGLLNNGDAVNIATGVSTLSPPQTIS